jgi:hypothetical protein
MGLADDLAEIECEECRKLAIEDIAEFAIDPENLARLDPEGEMRQYLRELLNRPDDNFEQLAKLLASKAKARVGLLQS